MGLYGAEIQRDWACCHPTDPRPAHPHVTQIRGFVRQTKVSECALHLERPAVNTVASHGMPLFAFIGQHQHQTQTGALWVGHDCGAFSLLANQLVAGQHCGHTLWAQTLYPSGCEGFAVTRDAVPVLKQGGSRHKLKRWVIGNDVFSLWCTTWEIFLEQGI